MDLENVQKFLSVKGLYEGAVDGTIGEKSQKAVRKFQRTYGLNVDGVIGGNTKARIHSEIVQLQQFLAAGSRARFEGTADGTILQVRPILCCCAKFTYIYISMSANGMNH